MAQATLTFNESTKALGNWPIREDLGIDMARSASWVIDGSRPAPSDPKQSI